MKISSTALKAKRSCASGYRWFARRFKSPTEYQSVVDALVADGRIDDACWLLDQFGPIESVLVLDALSADAFVYAGSIEVRGEVDVESNVRTGGSLRAGGSIRTGGAISVGNDLHAGAGLRTLGPLRTGGHLVSDWSVEVHGALTCGGDLRVRGSLACGAALRSEGATVVEEDLEVDGMIHGARSLRVGGHLACTEGLRAGHGIQVGQTVRSGMQGFQIDCSTVQNMRPDRQSMERVLSAKTPVELDIVGTPKA